jgi:hypothetical protein
METRKRSTGIYVETKQRAVTEAQQLAVMREFAERHNADVLAIAEQWAEEKLAAKNVPASVRRDAQAAKSSCRAIRERLAAGDAEYAVKHAIWLGMQIERAKVRPFERPVVRDRKTQGGRRRGATVNREAASALWRRAEALVREVAAEMKQREPWLKLTKRNVAPRVRERLVAECPGRKIPALSTIEKRIGIPGR